MPNAASGRPERSDAAKMPRRPGPLVLDGRALARARAPGLADRGRRVAAQLGRRPRLGLMAFANRNGGAPYVERKIRACSAAGVEVLPLLLPAGTASAAAERALGEFLAGETFDGVFLEIPFPAAVDGAALLSMIPEIADVDIMTASREDHFFLEPAALPPLTVAAGLALLDGYHVDVEALPGVVVGHDIPFTQMFRAALARRGASMQPLVVPDAPDLLERVADTDLVVVSAAVPGIVPSTAIAPGAVVIDAGYFNRGGRGDVDTAGGLAHLGAIAPVPGGIGPMTVSALVERVIAFAEASGRGSRDS